MINIAVSTLGCPKNIVDSETLIGRLKIEGFGITEQPDEADVLILNTCGFVTQAVEESVNVILDYLEFKKHKKIISLAKGYKWLRKNVFKLAKQAVMKAGTNSYRDRRLKKRSFRQLWIQRISAALELHNVKYSRFIYNLQNSHIRLNRKMLADLAAQNPEVFTAVVEKTKK